MKTQRTESMSRLTRVVLGLSFICALHVSGAAENTQSKPVAEIFGKPVTLQDLDTPTNAATANPPTADSGKALQRQRQERLRALIWKAVFEDFARQRNITLIRAEIESHIAQHQRFQKEDRVRREKQRLNLIRELESPGLTEGRRQQAQAHLDTLRRLMEFDAQRDQELRDPAQQRMAEDAERRVSEVWVRSWKINQTLYREFGGRIIFRQAGWEPIDAYRKLLQIYEGKRGFVVHDSALRDAAYSYFRHNFVYADETRAKFYFEKPYWERTEAQMRAAGF